MANSTILITGCNRGLGLGMLKIYLARANVTAIAAVRDPTHSTARALASLPKGEASKLIVVKLDAGVTADAAAAVAQLKSEHGITSLDVVVANAAIGGVYPLVAAADPDVMLNMYKVNVVGSVLLFQATRDLLLASKAPSGGKFVGISSSAGWLTKMADLPVPNAVYGPTKTALNWQLQKAHIENEGLVVFPIDPGWVQTDMGNDAAVQFGMQDGLATLTIDQSVTGLVAVMDKATRESTGGKYMAWDGEVAPW